MLTMVSLRASGFIKMGKCLHEHFALKNRLLRLWVICLYPDSAKKGRFIKEE